MQPLPSSPLPSPSPVDAAVKFTEYHTSVRPDLLYLFPFVKSGELLKAKGMKWGRSLRGQDAPQVGEGLNGLLLKMREGGSEPRNASR